MLFTFKRDEEGRERIYVGDVCVAHTNNRRDVVWQPVTHYTGVSSEAMDDAIDRAYEAGFWHRNGYEVDVPGFGGEYIRNDVTVDVPVADNAVPKTRRAEGSLLTEMGIIHEDES